MSRKLSETLYMHLGLVLCAYGPVFYFYQTPLGGIWVSLAVYICLLVGVGVLLRRNVKPASISYSCQTVLRLWLSFVFFAYGFGKVLTLQFGKNYQLLDMPAGSVDEFALLILFYGHSDAYQIFIGASEVVCGVILWFRRTMLVGTLLFLVIIGNIVIINFAFDIIVKFFSTLLLVTALYLILPDVKKLFSIALSRASSLEPLKVLEFKWISRSQIIQIQTVLLLLALSYQFAYYLSVRNQSFTTYDITGAWEASDRYGSPYDWQRLFIEENSGPDSSVRAAARLYSGEMLQGEATVLEKEGQIRLELRKSSGSTQDYALSYELDGDILKFRSSEIAFNLYRKTYD